MNYRKHVIALLAALPLMVACSGDEGDDEEIASSSSSSSSSGNLCNLAILFLANPATACSQPSSGGGSSTPPPPTSPPPPPPPTGGTISSLGNAEFEPNDGTLNANPVQFATSNSKVGFYVDGAVSDADDADTFAFVRPRSREFRIQLCPPGEMICEMSAPIDTPTAYFEIVDGNGNVVVSSRDGQNMMVARIEAGISYYARVVAADTMGATVGYRFTLYERE